MVTASGPNQVGFLPTLSPRSPPDAHPRGPWGRGLCPQYLLPPSNTLLSPIVAARGARVSAFPVSASGHLSGVCPGATRRLSPSSWGDVLTAAAGGPRSSARG